MATPSIPQKRCTKCGIDYPATLEYFCRQGKYLTSWCKECRNRAKKEDYRQNKISILTRNKRYRDNNREKIRAQKASYYQQRASEIKESVIKRYYANKQEVIKSIRRWRKLNPEKVHYYRLKWRSENPEKARESQEKYRKEHLVKYAAKERNRNARKRGSEGTHTAADIATQLKRQKSKCYYCGCKLNGNYHVDHVVPLIRGGRNSPDNLVIACPICNMKKGRKLPHEWIEGGRLL